MAILRHFGLPITIKPLRETFELEPYFRCYPFERNASIIVQCNALSTLLAAFECSVAGDCDSPILRPSTLKRTGFITDAFCKIEDKFVRFLSFVLPSARR